MTDNLRDAAQAVLDRWDSLDWKAASTADYMHRLRAALAAAPQPAPVMQYYYKDNACPAEYSRAETCICWHDEGKGPFPDLKNGDAIPMAYGSSIGLTWRAAPQPAPADREALVEVIAEARGRFTPVEMAWAGDGYHDEERAIADALLARGLRLPGGEAMAWAVVDPVAGVRSVFMSERAAQLDAQEGDTIRRVELSWRVVEGGDDDAA